MDIILHIFCIFLLTVLYTQIKILIILIRDGGLLF